MKLYQIVLETLKVIYIILLITVPFLPKSMLSKDNIIREYLHQILSVATAVMLIILYNPITKVKKDHHDEFIVFMSAIFLLLSQIKSINDTSVRLKSIKQLEVLKSEQS